LSVSGSWLLKAETIGNWISRLLSNA